MRISIKKKITMLFILFLSMVLIPLLSVRSEKNSVASVMSFHADNLKNVKETNSKKCFCVFDEALGKTVKIPDKEFLLGCVASEMPANFEEEALKAQAVACYTYFCRARNSFNKSDKKEKNYEFTINSQKGINYVSESVRRQRWGENFDKHSKKTEKAVNSVFGEVVQKDDEFILAAYHAISSGKTEKSADVFGGDLSYLTNVESESDKLVSGYETTVCVSSERFKNLISEKFENCSLSAEPSLWVESSERTEGGMVKEITIGSQKIKGTEIRKLFALRSSDFDVSFSAQEDKFIFTVRGYGHGVGMSQYGAQHMAKQGADYKKILAWYYPGTSIVKLND